MEVLYEKLLSCKISQQFFCLIDTSRVASGGGRGAMPPDFRFCPPDFFLDPSVFFWEEEVTVFGRKKR